MKGKFPGKMLYDNRSVDFLLMKMMRRYQLCGLRMFFSIMNWWGGVYKATISVTICIICTNVIPFVMFHVFPAINM